MKLTDSIHLVASGSSGIGLTDALDCSVYYVDCGSQAVLIDSGAGRDTQAIVRQIDAANPEHKPIARLLLTHHHGDHAGGARALREHYGCPVAAPDAEADSILCGDEAAMGLDRARAAGFYPAGYRFTPCPVDLRLRPGDTVRVGDVTITAYEAAGHSLGGLCYHLRRDDKDMLFIGDLVAFGGLISLQNIPGSSVAAYSRSVLALEELPVDCFFPGHGCFSLSGGSAHIRAAAAAFRQLGIPKNAI